MRHTEWMPSVIELVARAAAASNDSPFGVWPRLIEKPIAAAPAADVIPLRPTEPEPLS